MPQRLWRLCAVHNQNPPHYNSVSVSRTYVSQKSACDLCHTHKCTVNTLGAAWGESPCHISTELWAARPSVGFPCLHVQLVWTWGDQGDSLAPRNWSGCSSSFFPEFNPSCKEAGEKLTSGFVKMSQVNVLYPSSYTRFQRCSAKQKGQ